VRHAHKICAVAGDNGKEYVLQSVKKDPSRAIVEELGGTFAEDAVPCRPQQFELNRKKNSAAVLK